MYLGHRRTHEGPRSEPSSPKKCSTLHRRPQEHSKSIPRPIRAAVDGGEQMERRKRLDRAGRRVGTNPDHFFITGLDSPCCLAVDSSHIYRGVSDADAPAIGRANLDGTNPDPNFITGLAHTPLRGGS
jgi:hypothetical protein